MDAPPAGGAGGLGGWLSDDQARADYSSAVPTSWPGGQLAPGSLPAPTLCWEVAGSLLLLLLLFNYKNKCFLSHHVTGITQGPGEGGKIRGHFKVLIPQKGRPRRLIHSLSKSVLSPCSVPDAVLGTGESGSGSGHLLAPGTLRGTGALGLSLDQSSLCGGCTLPGDCGVLGARHSAGHGERTVSLTHPGQTPGTPLSSFEHWS